MGFAGLKDEDPFASLLRGVITTEHSITLRKIDAPTGMAAFRHPISGVETLVVATWTHLRLIDLRTGARSFECGLSCDGR